MVIHIRKDGTKVRTVQGHKIKKSDVPEVYELLKRKERSADGENRKS